MSDHNGQWAGGSEPSGTYGPWTEFSADDRHTLHLLHQIVPQHITLIAELAAVAQTSVASLLDSIFNDIEKDILDSNEREQQCN